MNRIATIAVAAATLLSAAAPAFAAQTAQAPGRINVTLCERDALTQAAFRRNYGGQPSFVTADHVLAARASGERWSEPRCMTASEHQRLTQAMAPRTSRAAAARPAL
ncbi:hypothetical protein [Brevundimonas goettingensis]|jgi:hypothetical protein|uniref:Uncharacterized protein n=1 Tax=Brevundimonas goettingensis TaxID=2774190 RepID=A0A975C4S1_9CAUL|nr:hypothetical protein [Brevundimonas goettingensis]QTC91281.1 hypothetical protein IFJ75_19130 [Brevundimonas goettingensis]